MLVILLVSAFILLYFTLAIKIKTHGVKGYQPILLFGFVFMIDLYVPALIYWFFPNYFEAPYWVPSFDFNLQFLILILSMTFHFIFLISVFIFSRINIGSLHSINDYSLRNGAGILVLFLFSLSVGYYVYEIIEKGGVVNYIANRALQRFAANESSERDWYSRLKIHTLLIVSTVVFYYFYLLPKKKAIRFLVIFFIAFLASMSGYRGTFIFSILPFILLELSELSKDGWKLTLRSMGFLKASLLLIFIPVSIVGYGVLRDNVTQIEKSSNSLNVIHSLIKNLFSGAGYRGFGSILEYYTEHALLYGKTYFDMLLLPVPRLIYQSKPLWYGIDDITRGMGWPESTQSAVTMQGEAYANFGFVGIVVMPILMAASIRIAFGGVRSNIIQKLLYVSLGPALIATTNWMSFTGYMNHLVLLVMGYFLCMLMLKRN
jgi:oligosaccharide repeat unit polymerase